MTNRRGRCRTSSCLRLRRTNNDNRSTNGALADELEEQLLLELIRELDDEL